MTQKANASLQGMQFYTPLNSFSESFISAYNNKQPGDPRKLVEVMLDIVRGEGVAEGKEIPLSLPLGSDALATVKETLQRTENILNEWESVIRSTDFPKGT